VNWTASSSPTWGKHRDDAPLTATTIGKGLSRSAGAVANCLARLAKAGKLRQVKRRPRAYTLKEATSK